MLSDLDAPLPAVTAPVIAHGLGRSYGDVCLARHGTHLVTTRCARIRRLDAANGIVECDAGLSLGALIEAATPLGWFPPVVPGTRFVTIGGAVANDIHGKNHHVGGSFGRYVLWLRLRRTDGALIECSRSENLDLFRASIGGLGLTGMITRVRLQLQRWHSVAIHRRTIPFRSVPEFLERSDASVGSPFMVGWIDCLSASASARGVLYLGEPAPPGTRVRRPPALPAVPFPMPGLLLNRVTARLFNAAYHAAAVRRTSDVQHFESFMFPLDAVPRWNLLYGSRGFVQWQCVVPRALAVGAFDTIFRAIRSSREPAYLGVIKAFGDAPPEGVLSFARPGVTLALDFPMRGERTLRLLDALDAHLLDAGGALYAAKDARMSAATFRASYPRYREMHPHRDPGIQSAFWERVQGDVA